MRRYIRNELRGQRGAHQRLERHPLFSCAPPAVELEPAIVTSSFEELRQVCHRPEELHRLIGKRQKALTQIELTGRLIFGVHDNSKRGGRFIR